MEKRRAAGLLLVLGGAGCWQSPAPAPAPFAVARISPDLRADAVPLLLNDAITVYFNRPVDPLSVSRDSISVLDADGNSVPGRLRTGSNWVTFEPRAPLSASLEDGSLRPGRAYRLVVGGFPRLDCVRALDGSRLGDGVQRGFRTAARDSAPAGLPAPLRPLGDGALPFLVAGVGEERTLPVDNPRLRLRFSLPVLPTSLTPEAFQVLLVRPAFGRRGKPVELAPVEARLVSIDEVFGCTAELNLGSRPQAVDGQAQALQPGDFVFLKFQGGERAVRDYADRELQSPPPSLSWTVVGGSAAVLMRWPSPADAGLQVVDVATPGFELGPAGLQPLVRVEGGDGSLGRFAPRADVRLVPGVPFDRGDGSFATSRGAAFPFQGIDIPPGITVTIDARQAPVQLLALGSARIRGRLVIDGPPVPMALSSGGRADIATLRASASVLLLAVGGIEIGGSGEVGGSTGVALSAEAGGAGLSLALVAAGPVAVHAPIPNTVLATESGQLQGASFVERCARVEVRLTPGLPEGCACTAQALTGFRALPQAWGTAEFRIADADAGLRIDWQVAPGQVARPDRPDLDPARLSAFREAVDGQPLAAPLGGFQRLRLSAPVRGGAALPRVQSVSVIDR